MHLPDTTHGDCSCAPFQVLVCSFLATTRSAPSCENVRLHCGRVDAIDSDAFFSDVHWAGFCELIYHVLAHGVWQCVVQRTQTSQAGHVDDGTFSLFQCGQTCFGHHEHRADEGVEAEIKVLHLTGPDILSTSCSSVVQQDVETIEVLDSGIHNSCYVFLLCDVSDDGEDVLGGNSSFFALLCSAGQAICISSGQCQTASASSKSNGTCSSDSAASTWKLNKYKCLTEYSTTYGAK